MTLEQEQNADAFGRPAWFSRERCRGNKHVSCCQKLSIFLENFRKFIELCRIVFKKCPIFNKLSAFLSSIDVISTLLRPSQFSNAGSKGSNPAHVCVVLRNETSIDIYPISYLYPSMLEYPTVKRPTFHWKWTKYVKASKVKSRGNCRITCNTRAEMDEAEDGGAKRTGSK